jgi:glucose/arabinose dehydrogenase
MKHTFLLIAIVIAFASCQKNQYASVSASKVEETESQKLTQTPYLKVVTAEPTKTAATFEPEAMAQIAAPVEEMVVANSETRVATPQKMTFKERLMGKVIAKKIQKEQKKQANNANSDGDGVHPLALASGIAGVVSIVLSALVLVASLGEAAAALGVIAFFLGIAAVVTGFIGKSRINAGNKGGKSLAILGVITGLITTVFWIVLSVLVIAALASWGGA